MKHLGLIALTAVLAVLMSSCMFSDSKAPRMFVMTPLAQPTGAEGYPVVTFLSVNVPSHLSRIESVQMSEAGEVMFSSDWQWSDRFQNCVQDVLIRNQMQLMGADKVCSYYSKGARKPAFGINVMFECCSFSAEKKTLTMKGFCDFKTLGDEKPVDAMPFEMKAQAAGSSPEAIVKSYNELLSQLSEKLAEHLRNK